MLYFFLCSQIWSDVKNLESSHPKIIQPELFILNLSNSPLIPFHGEIQIMVLPPPPPPHNNKDDCDHDTDHDDTTGNDHDDDYHHNM